MLLLLFVVARFLVAAVFAFVWLVLSRPRVYIYFCLLIVSVLSLFRPLGFAQHNALHGKNNALLGLTVDSHFII